MNTSESYEIETGIPIPEKKNKFIKYPVKDMQIGESFFVPVPKDKTPAQMINRFRTMLKYHKVISGKEFTTRAMDGGIRIWRTK